MARAGVMHLRRGDGVACGPMPRSLALLAVRRTANLDEVTCGRCRNTYAGRAAASAVRA